MLWDQTGNNQWTISFCDAGTFPFHQTRTEAADDWTLKSWLHLLHNRIFHSSSSGLPLAATAPLVMSLAVSLGLDLTWWSESPEPVAWVLQVSGFGLELRLRRCCAAFFSGPTTWDTRTRWPASPSEVRRSWEIQSVGRRQSRSSGADVVKSFLNQEFSEEESYILLLLAPSLVSTTSSWRHWHQENEG